MTHSDEIEAMARALFAFVYPQRPYDDAGPHTQEIAREHASAAHAAVAPLIEARVREEAREACAKCVQEIAIARGRQECCGYGVGSPPECCADPVYLIDDRTALAAIRAQGEK